MNSFTKQKETRRHRKQTSGYQRRGSEVSEVSQSCPTLRNPMNCSPPGSSVHGILYARILEWVAMLTSGDLPNPGIEPVSPALRTDTLPSEPPGKPLVLCRMFIFSPFVNSKLLLELFT